MSHYPIIGRFAPTPSGPLHFGSLVAALASYCQARSMRGSWLLRIEDIDTPRIVRGASDDILKTLEAFGFEWDGDVDYQSNQFDYYENMLHWLLAEGRLFACECTRRSLRDKSMATGPLGAIYPGTCRNRGLDWNGHSIRLHTGNAEIVDYLDQILGSVSFDIGRQLGDCVLRRADGIYAYHLAVVLDDYRQKINQVVRGADLLEATCLHIYLQRLLGFGQPEYFHVPLVKNPSGEKLSKQTGARALDLNQKETLLISALQRLGQPVDSDLQRASVSEIMAVAVSNWNHRLIHTPEPD